MNVNVANLYDSRFSGIDIEKKARIWEVLCRNYFQQFVNPTDTILDIACGFGEFSNHIRAKQKIAIDLNPRAPEYLDTSVRFHQCSATDMRPIEDCSVNFCFSSNFLEHLRTKAEVDAVLAEILRVLKPGGTYLAMQPNIRFCYDRYWDFYDHYTALSDRSCSEAFQLAGFNVERLIPRFLPFSTKSNLPQHPLLVKAYLKFPLLWQLLGEQFLILGCKPIPD